MTSGTDLTLASSERDGELASLVEALQTKNAQLEHALASRVLIEQAKGVLAERYGIGVDAAFELLRAAARSNRIRIHLLAAQVVSSRTTPGEIVRVRQQGGGGAA